MMRFFYMDDLNYYAKDNSQLEKNELVRRTRLILKTKLNPKNRITSTNILGILVISYSFNIINCNLSEVKIFDIKV